MKKLLLIAGVLTSSTTLLADVGDLETYCGKVEFGGPGITGDEPVVDGLRLYYSDATSNSNIEKVIKNAGNHFINFSYEDSPHIYGTAAAVSGAFQNFHQADMICLDAYTVTESQWGTPTDVDPVIDSIYAARLADPNYGQRYGDIREVDLSAHRTYVVVANGGLNCRANPGTDSPIRLELDYGSYVEPKAVHSLRGDSWMKVWNGFDAECWVRATTKYLQLENH